jgi:hypothetical protein
VKTGAPKAKKIKGGYLPRSRPFGQPAILKTALARSLGF